MIAKLPEPLRVRLLASVSCHWLDAVSYADRAKAIKVKAFKNEEVSLAEKLNEEIAMLRMKLLEAVRWACRVVVFTHAHMRSRAHAFL
jgi:hypothetical protein